MLDDAVDGRLLVLDRLLIEQIAQDMLEEANAKFAQAHRWLEFLHATDGDADLEAAGDEEDSDGDDRGDTSWPEWHTLHASMKRGPVSPLPHEDAEEDDAAEEDDPPGACDEDEISTNLSAQWAAGAGCTISDPGGCQHDGEPDDGY
jgi:hypothetical protein